MGGLPLGSNQGGAHDHRSDADAAETPAELAYALALLWTAVDRRMRTVRATLDTASPRKAIDAYCVCLGGYEGIARLADCLQVTPQVPDHLRDAAPSWMP